MGWTRRIRPACALYEARSRPSAAARIVAIARSTSACVGASIDAMTDDLEALRVLKARYFRFVDTKSWDLLRELFTDDAAVDLGAVGAFHNADTFIAFVREALEATTTVHHGHMPELELVGPDEATGVWAMADILDLPPSPMKGYGHYHESYRRVDGQWRIASMRLTRLFMESAPSA